MKRSILSPFGLLLAHLKNAVCAALIAAIFSVGGLAFAGGGHGGHGGGHGGHGGGHGGHGGGHAGHSGGHVGHGGGHFGGGNWGHHAGHHGFAHHGFGGHWHPFLFYGGYYSRYSYYPYYYSYRSNYYSPSYYCYDPWPTRDRVWNTIFRTTPQREAREREYLGTPGITRLAYRQSAKAEPEPRQRRVAISRVRQATDEVAARPPLISSDEAPEALLETGGE